MNPWAGLFLDRPALFHHPLFQSLWAQRQVHPCQNLFRRQLYRQTPQILCQNPPACPSLGLFLDQTPQILCQNPPACSSLDLFLDQTPQTLSQNPPPCPSLGRTYSSVCRADLFPGLIWPILWTGLRHHSFFLARLFPNQLFLRPHLFRQRLVACRLAQVHRVIY